MATARDSSCLEMCFSDIVDGKDLELEDDVVDRILTEDLKLKLDTFSKDLIDVLPLMLVRYMTTWPGWIRSREYVSGALKFIDWYDKFKEYIRFKMNNLIHTEYGKALESIEKEKSEEKPKETQTDYLVKNKETQTDNLVRKPLAPFEIEITAPANIFNRLRLVEAENDISVELAPEIKLIKVTLKELLNWPFVYIEFISPELHFIRRNMNEFKRYVCLTNDQYDLTEPKKFDEIVPVNPNLERTGYSLNFLKSYAKQYWEILRTMPIMKTKAKEIHAVVEEFLKDVEEIDHANSMATNTKVTFYIGSSCYVRTRKKANSTKSGKLNENETFMVYTELLTPKMETSLIYFKGEQDFTKPTISFSYLNTLKDSVQYTTLSLLDCAVPKITFKCTLCDVAYDCSDGLQRHFITVHKSEPNFRCVACMKSLSVKELAGARWRHLCSSKPHVPKKANAQKTGNIC